MKKTILALLLSLAMVLSLSACGGGQPAQIETPAEEPAPAATEALAPEQAAPAETEAPAQEPAAAPAPARQDGERFDDLLMIEGMEETVHYAHLRRQDLGFEMDYDYENFLRQSTADRERFVSVWDNAEEPEYYLEVARSGEDAESAAAAVSETLSQDYTINRETADLDRAGTCIRIGASETKEGGHTPDHLQMVYIIPASDGCVIGWVHHGLDSADGFGRRFDAMMQSVSLLDRPAAGELTDELALTGVRNYCYSVNPDLEGIVKAGEYQVYWEIESSDAQQIVVLFRSYTGALCRYYIDRATGETYETEFVPGITAEETRTEESFNLWSYLG